MPKVFYASMSAAKEEESLLKKLDRLCANVGLGRVVEKGELVAVKMHFGEPGLYTYIRPVFVSRIVNAIRDAGGKPFLTDANTLYMGSRGNAVDHLRAAHSHGFVPPVVDAPVVIADGLLGHDFRSVTIKGRHFNSVKIGSAVAEAEILVGIAHFKGHLLTGFGGQLKNLGMGSGSRAGKQKMHSDIKPDVDSKKCKGCGRCIRHCAESAIALVEGKAVIDSAKCVGCAECVVTCRNKGIKINWDSSSVSAQEKIVEYSMGVVKDKKCAFFNFVTDITPDCDCFPWSATRLGPDVGVLASSDCVAIDQASIDLVVKEWGKNPFTMHKADWSVQLKYGEKMGLGSRKYELVEV
jgi:hypothetical protein